MEKKKTGVIFKKDFNQEIEGIQWVIKAGKVYPLVEESDKGILLIQDESTLEFVRVYVALIENDAEVVLYPKEDGIYFDLVSIEEI